MLRFKKRSVELGKEQFWLLFGFSVISGALIIFFASAESSYEGMLLSSHDDAFGTAPGSKSTAQILPNEKFAIATKRGEIIEIKFREELPKTIVPGKLIRVSGSRQRDKSILADAGGVAPLGLAPPDGISILKNIPKPTKNILSLPAGTPKPTISKTATKVTLSWPRISDVRYYKIYRDGEYIGLVYSNGRVESASSLFSKSAAKRLAPLLGPFAFNQSGNALKDKKYSFTDDSTELKPNSKHLYTVSAYKSNGSEAATTAEVTTSRDLRFAVIDMFLDGSARGRDIQKRYSRAEVEDVIYKDTDSLKRVIERDSYGQVKVVGGNKPVPDIYGQYKVAWTSPETTKPEYMFAEQNAAMEQAVRDGFDNVGFDYIQFSYGGVANGGVAWIGGRTSFVTGYRGQYAHDFPAEHVAIHELGHNLRLLHTGVMRCGSPETNPEIGTGKCYYSNPAWAGGDLMGYGFSMQTTFDAFNRNVLGWVPNSDTLTVTSGGTYTLKNLDSASGVRLIRIPREKLAPTVPTTIDYVLELRSKQWNFLYPSEAPAVNIMATIRGDVSEHANFGFKPTYLNGAENGFDKIVKIKQGESFIDAIGGIKITVNSISNSEAALSINTGSGPQLDNDIPSIPSELTINETPDGRPRLTFKLSTDFSIRSAVVYQIFRNGTQVPAEEVELIPLPAANTPGERTNTVGETVSWLDQRAPKNTQLSYYVIAKDAYGKSSAASQTVVFSTGGADTIPPTAPSNLRTTNVTGSSIALAWDASTDNRLVKDYTVFRNGQNITPTPITGTAYTDSGLTDFTSYTYTIKARDTSLNVSAASDPLVVRTLDTTPPTAPSNLQATEVRDTSVKLTWEGSTDNAGVQCYNVYRNPSPGTIGSGTPTELIICEPSLAYNYTDAQPNTEYRFRVMALDEADNESSPSNEITVRTKASCVGDTCVGASLSRTNLAATAADTAPFTFTFEQEGTFKPSGGSFGFLTTAATFGDRTLIGDVDNDSFYEFRKNGSSWGQQAKVNYDNIGAGDQFGKDIGLYENTAVVGIPLADSGGAYRSGKVYVYNNVGSGWTREAQLLPTASTKDGYFGQSVGIYGSTLVVGSPFDDSSGDGSGAVYVFDRAGSSWQLSARLTSPEHGGYGFGNDVSINNNVIAVSSSDGVYVFRKSGSWNFEQKLFDRTNTLSLQVSATSTRIAVSDFASIARFAPKNGPILTVHIFRNGNWVSESVDNRFMNEETKTGYSVGIFDNLTIVGSPEHVSHDEGYSGEIDHAGVVYVSRFGGETWTSTTIDLRTGDDLDRNNFIQEPASINFNNKHHLGFAIAMDEDTIIATTKIGYARAYRYTYQVGQTADLTPPSAPSNLRFSNVRDTSLTLNWDASVDNRDPVVDCYDVLSNAYTAGGIKISRGRVGTCVTGTSFSDSGLNPASEYEYWVIAKDDSGNTAESEHKKVTTKISCQGDVCLPPDSEDDKSGGITPPVPTTDTIPPTISLSGAGANQTLSGKLDLTAIAADNVGVERVEFFLDGKKKAEDKSSPHTYSLDTTKYLNGPHSISAKAFDKAGNTSIAALGLNFANADTTAPSIPSDLTAAVSPSLVRLKWKSSTDVGEGVAFYYVVENGITIAQTASTTFTRNIYTVGVINKYQAIAVDKNGNSSKASKSITATTPLPKTPTPTPTPTPVPKVDTTPPTAPTNLVATVVGTQVNLGFNSASDNTAVTSYRIFRNGMQIGTSSTNSFGEAGLLPATYNYAARAVDGAGNVSLSSNIVSVTVTSPTPTPVPVPTPTPCTIKLFNVCVLR